MEYFALGGIVIISLRKSNFVKNQLKYILRKSNIGKNNNY